MGQSNLEADMSDTKQASGVELKVIGVGLPRTGTLSLRAALECLGFPCYHGFIPSVERHDHLKFWMSCIKEGQLDTDSYHNVLGDYKAGVDTPFIIWWKDLIKLNPEAKVILSIRDPGRWHASHKNTLLRYAEMASTWPGSWFHYLIGFGPVIELMYAMFGAMKSKALNCSMLKALENEDTAVEFFNEHVKEVKELVPAANLLVFDLREGWDPLCEFLNVSKPESPFPRMNDTGEQVFLQRVASASAWISIVGIPCLVSILAVFFAEDLLSVVMLVFFGIICVWLFVKSYLFIMNGQSTQAVKK